MYYISNAYIFVKTWTSAIMKLYLWSTNNGPASQITNGGHGHWQGMKPANAKIVNCCYSSHKKLFHDSSVIVVDSTPLITQNYCAYSLTGPIG